MDLKFDKKAVGGRINQCREDAGFTQEKLAEAVGISQQHMSNIMKGKAGPSMTVLMRLAVALNISTDYLLSVDTSNGHLAANMQLEHFLAELSLADKQMCLALCRAYVDNKPSKGFSENEIS